MHSKPLWPLRHKSSIHEMQAWFTEDLHNADLHEMTEWLVQLSSIACSLNHRMPSKEMPLGRQASGVHLDVETDGSCQQQVQPQQPHQKPWEAAMCGLQQECSHILLALKHTNMSAPSSATGPEAAAHSWLS